MTPDEFASKYDVHKQIAQGPVRSYFGRSRAAKVVALMHYLDGGDTPENAARLAQVRALAASRKHLVLDVCDVGGTPVVVTRFILGFTTFDAWLVSETAASSPQPTTPAAGETTPTTGAPAVSRERQPEAPAAAQRPAAKEPGDFTRMFGQPASSPGQPPAGLPPDISTAPTVRTERVAAPSPTDAMARPPETTPRDPAPGDFTKLFHAQGAPPEPSAPATPGPPPAGPAPAAPPRSAGAPEKAPGEFTSLFAAGGDAPPPHADAPSKGPGEFTSLFTAGADQPPPATPTSGPAPEPPAPRRGEFTALFGKRAMPEGASPLQGPLPGTPPPPTGPTTQPERLPLAEPQDAGDDLYRRLHSTSPPAPASPPPQGAPAPGPPAASPGAFTRMFGASSAVPPTPQGPPSGLGPGASMPQPRQPETGPGLSAQPGSDYLARLQGTAPAAPSAGPPVPSTAPGRSIASEFTRALRRISASVLPPAEPEATAAAAPAGPRRSALPWVIAILAVFAVVAVGIVLYFLLTAG